MVAVFAGPNTRGPEAGDFPPRFDEHRTVIPRLTSVSLPAIRTFDAQATVHLVPLALPPPPFAPSRLHFVSLVSRSFTAMIFPCLFLTSDKFGSPRRKILAKKRSPVRERESRWRNLRVHGEGEE